MGNLSSLRITDWVFPDSGIRWTKSLPPISQVTMGKPVNLSEPQFPHLLNEDNGSAPPSTTEGHWEHELIYVKSSE